MKLIVESREQEITRLNGELKQCQTCEDFEKLQRQVYDSGMGYWFYTKRNGQELNSIYTRISRTSGGRLMYSSDGKPITKDGKDCIAYDTVRSSTTRTVTISNIYKHIVIR